MIARGLTLIEVLLASALLASITAVVAGVTSDIRQTSAPETDALEFDTLAVAAPELLERTELPLRLWEIGDTENVDLANEQHTLQAVIERLECPNCPSGLGLFEIRTDIVSLHRFASVVERMGSE